MRPCVVAGALLLAAVASGCDSSPTTPTPTPGACAYQLSAPARSFNADGGATTITVATGAQCSWSARADASWITIVSGVTGTGPGAIGITVASNPEAGTREANITVADQSLRMSQEGRQPSACSYAFTSGSQRVGSEGGTGVATVTTEARCSWTVTTSDSWLTVSPSEGSGTANVTFTVAPWTGTTERSATMRVMDQTLTVRQDPPAPQNCEYSVSPVEMTLHWHHTGGEVRLTTRGGCPWTVEAGEPWITVSGPTARDGEGPVQFTTPVFTDETRRAAPIELRWPTPTAGQNVWITQEGCRYGLSETSRMFTAAGGSGRIDVFGDPFTPVCSLGCPWTVLSQVSWIRITSGSPGSGDNPFSYEVQANGTGQTRTGTMTVMGRIVTITQLAQ
jgi:hypothetical protein